MKERSEYKVKIQGVLVDVTKEIYLTYYQMARREKHLEEKDAQHGVVSYGELDTVELLGEEAMPDMNSDSVEDSAIHMLMCEKLNQCLMQLPASEAELIIALFFDGNSERQISIKCGIPYMTIHDRKIKILGKLKKLMEK